jgi:secreted trypsin-like serine protease
MKRFFILSLFAITLVSCSQKNDGAGETKNDNLDGVVGGQLETNTKVIEATPRIDFTDRTFCTGIYLGNSRVLTANHCFKGDSGEENKRVSRVTFFKNNSGTTQKVICTANAIINMENFTGQKTFFENDLALIKLNTDANCSISTIAHFNLDFEVNSWENELILSSGLGNQTSGVNNNNSYSLKTLENKTDYFVNTEEKFLQVFDITAPGATAEQKKEGAELLMKLTSQYFKCFRNPNGALYFGDSGGPSYYLDSQGDLKLNGLFSVIFYSPRTEPIMYCMQNFSYYRAWLEKNVN